MDLSAVLFVSCFLGVLSQDVNTNYPSTVPVSSAFTEHPGGTIIDDKLIFARAKSPYWLRNDIVVERNAEMIVEPGVTIRVEPQVGITVRGVLTAVGTETDRIVFTSSENSVAEQATVFPNIRLVDGPTILAGRVQIYHNEKWRSVCTNSKNWTVADMQTACRQLGFQGGAFFMWMNRQMPLQPRLLYEEPKCLGTESAITECQWSGRQLGSGVCDYHPDLAIQCLPRHDHALPYWRGLRFEYAKFSKVLTLQNTLYVPTSQSKLHYVSVMFAGNGRDHNTTSALQVEGVPPNLQHVEVVNSAYNGVNVTQPDSPLHMYNCTVKNNRGHGIFINSSYGYAHVDGCTVTGNGGDGVRYVFTDVRPDEETDQEDYSDFCTFASASGQIYPVELFARQDIFSNAEKSCYKTFNTKYGHVITLTITRMETDRNNSATLEVFDGSSINSRLIAAFPVRNNTRVQTITTNRNQIFIRFRAEPRTKMFMYMRLTSGYTKSYDLNVTNSEVSDNNGRGIAVDNLKSQLHVHKSTVSNNKHVAGVHVTSGVGDVNVTESRISFNIGDGINITYTGGSRNISKTFVTSNYGYGIAVWLNDTKESEYVFINQTSVVQYSDIIKNLDIGVLHGNYCSDIFINITGNTFKLAVSDALEIMSCWKASNNVTRLQIGHNEFLANKRIAVKISPALNMDAKIEYNHFKRGTFGGLLIRNKPLEEFNVLKTKILVEQNYFLQNSGTFAVNLGLSPYSDKQYLLFTRNFVKDNEITEPFQPEDGSTSRLVPRSRVAAPVVVASNNVEIFRNIIENPYSNYEIGSHFEDQSKVINCTFNWLGYSDDERKLFSRVFHRYDRYNLARIEFIPYLLHNSNPNTNKYSQFQLYVPIFHTSTSNVIGGEIEGEENLPAGEYIVDKDINIRPNGKLTIEPGVTLKFPPSTGMMVGGRLEARGVGPDSIRFTLKEQIVYEPDNQTSDAATEKYDPETETIEVESKIPIRILGGKTELEGRLQVKIDNQWGTVCNYGWGIKDAALACQQLGLVLNPEDWYLERSEIPDAGTTENVLLSNVQCDEFDLDITKCRAEKMGNFESSCGHDNDVGIRCYTSSWAGVRFGALAERSDLQYITIEKSGLLDYATSSFKPALQLDFARQNFENIRITNNYHDGMGIMYSDIYTDDSVNIVKNSEFSNNKGAGISFKQLGLTVHGSIIENNFYGIRHYPMLSGLQQRELAGWFTAQYEEFNFSPLWIPQTAESMYIEQPGQKKYLVTTKVTVDPILRTYSIRCNPGYVIGIQLLNPIENRSTERIEITDALTLNEFSVKWDLTRDLTVFPATSSGPGIIMHYNSGTYAIGGTVLVISAIRAPIQNVYNRIVKGPVPTLAVHNTKIRKNEFGVHASYYNRYLNELGEHFLRKANETLKFISCDISYNRKEAVFVHSPHWDLHKSNISEIKIMVNNSLITDNGKGFFHFSRDMRSSNNLFHYILQDDTIERNKAGGFDISLPYVWQYNENFTHSVYMNNNTWRNNKDFGVNIDGHYAVVNLTRNLFTENQCKSNLLLIQGMEKKLLVDYNRITNNVGKSMVAFNSDSQSEIIGNVPGFFVFNELRYNKYLSALRGFGVLQSYADPSAVISFKGIQKVVVRRNLFSDNNLDYQLIAGIKTAKVNNFLDVAENWWGSNNEKQIKQTIFDFDDWNNHAIAMFRPYLIEDSFDASHSVSFEQEEQIDLDHLGGRLTKDLVIPYRVTPYLINSDITVMPNTKLIINPGVTMEFASNVGILVLGTLKAEGTKGSEIIMRPLSKIGNLHTNNIEKREIKRDIENLLIEESIRLCQGRNCQDNKLEIPNEGFLEYFNKTTLQWIPMCDPRFTERNAQVVCRELGFDPVNAFFDHDIRIEFHSNSLTRIWSWPEPLQCKGTENRYEECPIRLNGQQFGHRHECKWDSKFVFIHCGRRNLPPRYDYWGGIRFANSEFEQNLYAYRVHDINTHTVLEAEESSLQYVKIIGAGILHNEKSPAVQAVIKSPKIQLINVTQSASHGINLISPTRTMNLLYNSAQDTLGVGINFLTLSGEGRESDESSFMPLKDINIPYNLFGLIDICDTTKEIRIEERILVYYKYDNHPVNCVKIFRSAYNAKPLGFRLMQFNLFNSSMQYGIPDFISLHDGDIYNQTSKVIARITMKTGEEKRLFKTRMPSLSVKLFANGASSSHGFIAEVVTLPISAIGPNRDVQHNISYSVINNNREGGLLYFSVGEVNPVVTIDRNQFKDNCKKFYGNFTTCKAAVDMDVQNTQSVFFRNNLIEGNQGGLRIEADSRGSATSLKGYIRNNLFVNNMHLPALYVEGRQSSPYQEVVILHNYFTRNVAPYANNIVLKQVVSSFNYNYVKRNIGLQNLEVSGFDRVRLPIYQTTTHNGFYHNYAVHIHSRSTVIAGTAGQSYVDNIFFNPDNDYEMITVNKSLFEFNSTLEMWKPRINARYNYWGFNTTLAVSGRIRDLSDDPTLLEVDYVPFYMNNETILEKKCPPGWSFIGDTCYMYIGAPMTFHQARAFCQADNASVPYLIGNANSYILYDFLRKQQQWYPYSERVWVQHIDRINQCTSFLYQSIEIDDCEQLHPFICEIDPKVAINPLAWHGDVVTVAVIGSFAIAILLIAIILACWWSKSKYRQAQRLERRNSIRQSLHSLRSVGVTPSGFSDLSYRRKATQLSTRSTDTLTKNSDYKKMVSNGSIDSMEKSTYTSSIEDNQSYDIYETHNPNPSGFAYNPTIQYHKSPSKFDSQKYNLPTSTYDLAFKNEGFRDNSTFASNSNYQSRAESTVNEEVPIIQSETATNSSYPPSEYYNTDTLPLSEVLGKSDSTLDLKQEVSASNGYAFNKPDNKFLAELKSKVPPQTEYSNILDLPTPPEPPRIPEAASYSPTYSEKLENINYSPDYNIVALEHPKERPRSANILDTDLDEPVITKPVPKARSKSEALLETNFDFPEPQTSPVFNHPLSEIGRSRSQPLETAM